MVLHLFDSLEAQSIFRSSLDESVDEVYALPAPAIGWYFIQLHLLGQHLFSDLLSIGPHIGSASSHELKGDDPQCEEINGEGVVGLADDFRSHVSGGATGVLCVVGLHFSGYAQISHPQVPALIQH